MVVLGAESTGTTTLSHDLANALSARGGADASTRWVPESLYLLTSPEEVPFHDDGLRDGESIRPWMTERFREVLAGQPVPWLELRGNRQERLDQALTAVDRLLAESWRLTDPLG